MISPMTPAGTRIVVVKPPVATTGPKLYKLEAGDVYTVEYIGLQSGIKFVKLREVEFPNVFTLCCFELAALPKSITDTLTAYPDDVAKEIERLEGQEILHAEVKEWLRVILPPL